MAICKNCGKKYSIWSSSGTASGVCNECWPEQSKRETEERNREAPITLQNLFTQHVPSENAKIIGAAYWNTLGTAAGTGFAKFIFGGLFGIFGMILIGSEHRMGIVAVTKSELFLIDFGKIAGENLTHKNMGGIFSRPSVKKAPLRNLTAECDSESCVLTLKGDLKVKVTFPSSFEEGNPSKASMIAKAIQSHREARSDHVT